MIQRETFWTCFLSLALAVNVAAQDWPQFLGPNRNGTCSVPGLQIDWPKEGPRTVWQTQVGEGFSAPVVADEKLLIFQRLEDKERLDCFHARSGKALWHFDYPCSYTDSYGRGNGPRATPSIAEDKVFAFGADGMLHCLKLSDGKPVWSLDTKEKFKTQKGFFGVASSPLVEGKTLLLNVGGKDDAGIIALNTTDGKLIWKASDDQASYSSPVAASINQKRYAFFLTRNFLVALEPANGKVFFQFPWQPAIHASVSAATPLIIDDLIFISASYGAGAAALKFTEAGPQKLWSGDDILSNHYATSVHHQSLLYGFDGRQEEGCNLRCVELKTGKIRWTLDRFGAATVTLVNNDLLVLTEKGELICAPADGNGFKPKARAQILPSSVRAYPAIAHGMLYARSQNKLVCLDLSNKP